MRSHTGFEDLTGLRKCLGIPPKAGKPGYWQKQDADDVIFARGLLQANWHPGWLQNRRGFAGSPHFLHAYGYTPHVRS